jgi:hypothetical protein
MCTQLELILTVTNEWYVCSLSYPACKAHAPYYIVIWSLSGCTIFYNSMSQTARFSEEKYLNVTRVFLFSLQLLSETFITLRRIQRGVIVNVSRKMLRYQVS